MLKTVHNIENKFSDNKKEMIELMKNIEAALILSVDLAEAIKNGVAKKNGLVENNAVVIVDCLDETLDNFAQLCNMVEVK